LNNIIENININAANLTEEDIDLLIPQLVEYFNNKICSLAKFTYETDQKLALSAFKEKASEMLKNGTVSFISNKNYLKSNRSIEPYLLGCLNNLSRFEKRELSGIQTTSVPLCPGCKTLGEKEFLDYEGKLLRCKICTKKVEILENIEKKSSKEEYEYRIRKVFSLHSRKGRRCPNCNRFVPESLLISNHNSIVSCPYDNCSWFGTISELDIMSHPVGKSSGKTITMNSTKNNISNGLNLQDTINSNSITSDIMIEQSEQFVKEFNLTKSIITSKKNKANKKDTKLNKKYLMYKAFDILLDQDPVGMINYLIHGKSLGDRPIQSLIFQQYIHLIENLLPFTIDGEDGPVEVFSLLDKNLNLFLGMSEFTSYVRESGLITNNTHEIFTGSKCKGPCFMGWLCNITDDSGKSLISEVDYYTFSNIKMKSTVPQNTMVNVVHFRIPPHYEMYSLISLQRIRRDIVDSIYKRLNGVVRPLRGAND
jgi:Pyruvate/2-oxoacid:ferredoxin oxidoreductase delta subunit